jgi:hypothetical protein
VGGREREIKQEREKNLKKNKRERETNTARNTMTE